MNQNVDELIRKMRALEDELEVEYRQRRESFDFIIKEKRVRFAEEVAAQQRCLKSGLFRYLAESHPLNVLTAPVIYGGFLPLVLLDLFFMFYLVVCFPIYGIPKVNRSEYFIFDREDLPYLNVIEKFNCFYCAYANGLAGFAREISARTEQYWCPIKHARRIRAAHGRYPRFFEFGDAESYRKGLERLRRNLDGTKRN